MGLPHDMDCPECAAHVTPMPGSTWAIAWYSCGECGTFWYARLRVGRGSDALPAARMIGAAAAQPAPDVWSIEELEAEADALRKESDSLPQGNLEALRLHLEKLKVLADAINQRLDSRSAATTRVRETHASLPTGSEQARRATADPSQQPQARRQPAGSL
jgi:hypothetical protein